ncbi:SGNH/GDSL hydrolase family protein [Rhizobium terrae]|uniref:SGNH/GDSL hydrolase family protein n=1 Tax=Rhizobium terrae TaxID=2171756 RepID=UPI000E3E4DDA|nr:SGNH/GDSL hydrolase family protein [Rhizobium terrae]
MKQILAFGDSLTWGASPGGGRHPFEDRWTSVVEAALSGVRVIAEGLPGRTTAFDDPLAEVDRNGSRVLPILLGSHDPLDLVIVMLGTNELKGHICGKAAGSAEGIEKILEIVAGFSYCEAHAAPGAMIISPPHFRNPALPKVLTNRRDIEESLKLAPFYKAIADRRGCLFFDAATVAEASPIHGVHLNAENTRAIGATIAKFLKETDRL